MLFGIEFAKMNQTLFERCRETTGCGGHENRTFAQCMESVYAEKIKNKSPAEVKTMLDEISTNFQSKLSADIDASKLKDLEYIVLEGFIHRNSRIDKTMVCDDFSLILFFSFDSRVT